MTKLQTRTLSETLKWVNSFRKKTGMKPIKVMPKGEPREPERCPIARGINHGIEVYGSEMAGSSPRARKALITVFGKKVRVDEGNDEALGVTAPACVGRFVRYFDSGVYPDLEA